MTHRLEYLLAKDKVPYTSIPAKTMPPGSREEQKQADGAHRLLARGWHGEFTIALTEDGTAQQSHGETPSQITLNHLENRV